jgi:hypothetical protein
MMTDTQTIEATDELTETELDTLDEIRIRYSKKAKDAFAKILLNARERGQPSEAIKLAMLMKKCDGIAMDAAHKSAPYRHSKLEAIDIKQAVEMRYVIRAPQEIKNVDEWMKATGAKMLVADKERACRL